MAQFDVHRIGKSENLAVVVQHKFLDDLKTRLIIPLLPRVVQSRARLAPIIVIDGKEYVLSPHAMTTVQHSSLGPLVGNLEGHHREIIDAIDFMVLGF